MQRDFTQEQSYIRAKKRVKAIKGFYVHLVFYSLFVPIIILFNIKYTPQFHWFWFSIIGWGIHIVFHWFSLFSSKKITLRKTGKKRKLKNL